MMELKKHEKSLTGGTVSRSIVCEPEHSEGPRPPRQGGAFSDGGRYDGCLKEGIIGGPVVSAEEGAVSKHGREWLLVGLAVSLALHAAVILFVRTEKNDPVRVQDRIEIEFYDTFRYAESGLGETAPDDGTLQMQPAIEPQTPVSTAIAQRPKMSEAAALPEPPHEARNTDTITLQSLPEAPVKREEPETIEDPVMQVAVAERGEPEIEAIDPRGEPGEQEMVRRPDERLIDGEAAPATESAAGVVRGNPPDHVYAVKRFVERIDGKKMYPYPARKKGMQGTVLMLVRLDVGGELLEVRVLRSSGFGILDKAALSLVRQVVPYPHNTGVVLEIEVPIRYTLLD
jgi:protein TonB